MATGGSSAPDRSERGQMGIDFLIGMTVFFLAIVFVFGFIPGMIDPFTGAQQETLVADRTATQLSDSMLGTPGRPGMLNATCTFGFFNASLGNGGGCPVPFDESNSDLTARVGIHDTYRLNVTIERNVSVASGTDIVCTDGTNVSACTGSLTRLAAGPSAPTTSDSVSIARRTVFLDRRDFTMVVRLW